MNDDGAFTYNGGKVSPGETQNIRYGISETYLGDPVRIPVTIINGKKPGPTAFLSAAAHGDELNGIEVVREVAHEWDLTDLAGTLVCMPVLNVPGFLAQQRYLPIYDRDLNRSFPGREASTSAKRMAYRIFKNFIEPCDIGLDFHTSTRGRTNMLHVRADMADVKSHRLAMAYGSNVILDSEGPDGTLRGEATRAGVPTITIEMGEAHRFQRTLIDDALAGVESVFAEYGMLEQTAVRWPGWRTIITGDREKTWIRADVGGIVDMHYERGALVHEGDRICTITNPFKNDNIVVEAPFTGLLVGILENPVVYPGNPLCHLVELGETTRRVVELEQTPPNGDAT
ncbi:succinylglutamate desuccinylase/aspartoacylase family protein [Natronocalculus amylovorans]|uniref:Succinylglutamate desuccinylase/aspartoacylase family protein n=1 Tax=Natronocalculus amylovorans TaxID=2917812 RepID=A0AAE3K923_9EURY|nr:succinylglutamate desuccinylase/aspartoacylase family protein [Natronocalculus amylovorans]MCL9817917.1 succinylglutamate desuccinylase/aspartoacylase family protein [Natronocalculus amylovorans]NUE03148.1 succinylglutamate desuccinylase/aspartoacylase family protein [Halorubraceae archaeon YAN]